MNPRLVLTLAVGLTIGAAGATQAQVHMHLGPQVGYNFTYKAVVLGAQLGVPIRQHFEFYPSFNYYFVSAGSVWDVNLDVKYRLPIDSSNWFYVGGGLNITETKAGSASSTNPGANLIAGVETRIGAFHPFGEFRFTAGNNTTVQAVGGLGVRLPASSR